jgi:hypothetical protein
MSRPGARRDVPLSNVVVSSEFGVDLIDVEHGLFLRTDQERFAAATRPRWDS